jgi:hypothetical protein
MMPAWWAAASASADCDLQRLIERQRAFLQPLLQRLAFEVLHDEEVDRAVATNVVHGADVRMRQL